MLQRCRADGAGKNALVAGAFGVIVSAAMKTLSAKVKIGLMLCWASLAWPGLAAPWVQTTSLPDGYNAHTLVYASGYLYNIGGSDNTDGDAAGTNVFCAQVHSDGTIGAWTNATSLPEAVLNHASVVANGFVYVLGGYHFNPATFDDVASDIVYYSKVNTNGSLDSWQTANPLPNGLVYLSASVWNNTIYVVGGLDANSDLTKMVYSAQIQADGSISAWITQAQLPVPIYTQAEVANGFLYVIGGLINGGSEAANTVYYTKINSDGTLAGWIQTTLMPQRLSSFGVETAGGRVYTIGGYTGGSFANSFYKAMVMGDGSLNTWSTGTPLPQPLDQFGAAVGNSYIFISGGSTPSDTLSAVYSMALPAPPVVQTLVAHSFTNGNFQVQLASSTNTGFGLLASPDLINWTNLGWGFTGTNGLLSFQDTNAASFPNRFYRAYWPLP
jgi:hypothetical protein